jgi:hypothetical protein
MESPMNKESVERSKASSLTQNVRKYLEWSWNFGIAEELAQNSTKGMARLIEGSGGIVAGADVDDEELVEAFLSNRIEDLKTLQPAEGWNPDVAYHGFTKDELVAALRSFVGIDELIARASIERGEDDEDEDEDGDEQENPGNEEAVDVDDDKE